MNPNDQAFPTFGVIHWNKDKQQFEAHNPMPGMNIRLYIATHVLQGFLSDGWDLTYEELASLAFRAADILIEQEKKH